MTLANPPYPYFDGITYNSQFFNTSTDVSSSSSTGGLTQAQANLLYLQKTTNDTATALETFSGGIRAQDIDNNAGSLNLNTITGNEIYMGQSGVGTGITVNGELKVLETATISGITTYSLYYTGNLSLSASSSVEIDTSSSFNATATFNSDIRGSAIYCNFHDAYISGTAPMYIGNSYATSVEIGGTAIATNVLGALNASGGIKTNAIDRITSGSLAIGSNTLTTAVSIQKQLTLSNPLILGSVPTSSTELGYTELNAFTGTAVGTGSISTAGTPLASLPAGVWSISYLLKVSGDIGSITVSRFYSYVEASPAITGVPLLAATGGANTYSAGTGQTDASANQSGSVIVKTTAATVFTLKYYLTSTATGLNSTLFRAGCYISATRIA